MKRRRFLQTSAAASAVSLLPMRSIKASSQKAKYFSLHPFINANPDAVFIMQTSAASKHDSKAIKSAGEALAASLFSLTDNAQNSYPLSYKIVLKPNLTSRGSWQKGYTTERSMGVITDVSFVEGVIEGMKGNLQLGGEQFYIREVNGKENLTEGGYGVMADRTGADVRIISTQVNDLSPEQVVWKETPQGVWFNHIPYLWPVNSDDSVLINIAKLKAHGMGLTLTAKNIQGTIAAKYQQHCTAHNRDMSIDYQHVQPNAKQNILNNYHRHVTEGIPRWDKPGQNGGLWQETWASRCIDNNSTLKAVLHIIEGVYAHDGNFIEGPHNGFAEDFLTNIVIFGRNPFHVDIIGTWLAGHEPGNFGLFHLARERGLSTLLNPHDIPLYEWSGDGSAVQRSLDNFERTPLMTYYLQRDYNGQNEDYWHLVDEPYDYSATGVLSHGSQAPDGFKLHQNYPNPFNGGTSISYNLPENGYLQISVYDMRGRRIANLKDGVEKAGAGMVFWHADDLPSGTYLIQSRFAGMARTIKATHTK